MARGDVNPVMARDDVNPVMARDDVNPLMATLAARRPVLGMSVRLAS